MPTHNDYQVGWICALSLEFAAAEAMLDTLHEALPNRRDDANTYVFGSIRQHNVVIACLPVGVYGTTSATSVGMQMRASFPSLRFCLLVGVAGGAPAPHADIRLGDVVVSKPTGGYGGVIQYDYGKAVEDGEFVLTGMLDKPPAVLLTALARLQARHHLRGNDIRRFYKEALSKYDQLAETFSFPGRAGDVLFMSDHNHVEGCHNDCDNCDQGQIHSRRPRSSTHPRVFYGLVASANQVLRSAARRDVLARRHGILCFEMEAAGLIDILPCLVIRGICDYCDSHKNKQWQGYASMTAAAYAKELLSVIPSNEVSETKTIKDGFSSTNNMLPITPSGLGQTASMRNIKAPSPEPISAGFDRQGNDRSHSMDAEVSWLKPRGPELLEQKGNRFVICIELGYSFSTAAWMTPKGIKSYKLNCITSWPGRLAKTHQVPTEVGYKNGEVFWGYGIPENTARLAFLMADRVQRYAGNDRLEYSRIKFAGDYILGIYCHIRSSISTSAMARLGCWEVEVVLAVPSAFQPSAKGVESMAKQVFVSDKSVRNFKVVLGSKAAAVGQIFMLPTPSLGAYVVCDMRANSTRLGTYNFASANPMVIKEISYTMERAGVRMGVNIAIEDMCRQKLQLSSVHVNTSHLQQAVMAFGEDIRTPRFVVGSSTRKHFIDIRRMLLKAGVRDDYTYEPYLSSGHICLTDVEVETAFNNALSPIKKFITAKISFRMGQIKGIILAGSWGSNPYVYQHLTSVYTDSYEIRVFPVPNSDLPVLRGAVYMGLSGETNQCVMRK